MAAEPLAPTEDRRPVTGEPDRPPDRRNVRSEERAGSVALGLLLLRRGLRRRSLGGWLTAFAGTFLLYRGLRGYCPAYGRLGVSTARESRYAPGAPADATEIERAMTIDAPAAELAEYWRDPEELSRLLGPLVDVSDGTDDRFRWTVEGPLGRSVSWETRFVEDRPGELLRWESTAGASVPNEGAIRFRPAPGDQGTEVHLRVRFDPPGGDLGGTLVERLGFVPGALASKALRRLKSLAETGEIPTLDRNPSDRGRGDLL